MPTYIRNPEQVEAIQYTGEPNNTAEVARWVKARGAEAVVVLVDGRRVLQVVRDDFEPIHFEVRDYLCLNKHGFLFASSPVYFEKMYSEKKTGCDHAECPYCETGATALPSPVSAMDVVERGL